MRTEREKTTAMRNGGDRRGRVSRRLVGPALFATLALALLVAPGAQASLVYDHSFGGSGTGGGEFSAFEGGPGGVAVNNTTGDVYVTDPGQNRVEAFDSEGDFKFMWGEGVDENSGNVCTAASGHTCTPGQSSGSAGAFISPRGIGIDQATGDIFVEDAGNNRVDKFSAGGSFILMWGKGVDQTSGGNLCTAASGDVCKTGAVAGDKTTTPPTPTANGVFGGWNGNQPNYGPGIAVDHQGFVYVTDPHAINTEGEQARVQKFDSDGSFVSQIASSQKTFIDRGLNYPTGLAVAPDGDLFVMDENFVKQFEPSDFSVDGKGARYDHVYAQPSSVFEGVRQVAVDPSNGFVFTGTDSESPCPGGSVVGYHISEFASDGQELDCFIAQSPEIDNGQAEAGMAVSDNHRMYVADRATDMIRIYTTPVAEAPTIGTEISSEITSKSARLRTEIAANLGNTTFTVEYGTSPCSSSACASTPVSSSIGAAYKPAPVDFRVEGLEPGTTYHYRFVATNSAGPTVGVEHVFATFPAPVVDNSCANNLARQQTRSALLLDCRAYELVSAESTGGYNVESDLVPGGEPFGGYPSANGKVLYAVHDGGIPGTGKPTNRGPDPYVATRGEHRWTTNYVGVPADAPSSNPFQSTVAGADAGLDTLAFGGPDICNPCFADGSAGIPVRTPSGGLVQGMAGSIPVTDPEPAGIVKKPLSADGSELVFGSKQQFEQAGNSNGTDLTLYERNLAKGTTEVVSTLPDGSTIQDGEEVAELDVSRDGSRVLIGTDGSAGEYAHLYMHIAGSERSIDVTPGLIGAAEYAGMTADGSMVLFTTADPLASDGDSSVDLYRADIGASAATLTRVSAGTGGTGDSDGCDPAGNSYNSENWNTAPGGPTDCSVVAIGGGGGTAPETGTAYFLSPEKLDGRGISGAPNLFEASPGSSPKFVATLESGASQALPPAAHVLQHTLGGSYSEAAGTAIDPVGGGSYVFDAGATVQSAGGFVQKFSADGSVDSSFGSAGKIDGSDSPTGPFRELGEGSLFGFPMGLPTSIAVDSDPSSPSYRDLYVIDLSGGVVDKFGPDGTYLSQIVGITFPCAVAVNPSDGRVYVESLFGQVDVFDAEGNPAAPTTFSVSANFTPADMAVDGAGDIFVTNTAEVLKYGPAGTLLETFSPNPALGVAVDSEDGHVYVSEGPRVVEYEADGTEVGVLATGLTARTLAVRKGRVVIANKTDALDYSPPITPPDRAYDSPLAIDSVREPANRRSDDFQTNAGGDDAVYATTLPITGFDSGGRYNLYRYSSGTGESACVSCNTTLATPTSDAALPANGLGLTDGGAVFFTSGEPLVLRDNNDKKDAYEWENGKVELISSGKDSFDSGMLSATSDGTDAFFFTRETLAPNDANGTLMKIYDARSDGGFFEIPNPPPCASSDECHGPSSPAAGPATLGTLKGTGGNAPGSTVPTKCKKGFVRKHGHCVKKHRRHRRHRKHHSTPGHG
jgi:hypothetical protein